MDVSAQHDLLRRKSEDLAELELFVDVCTRALRQATKEVEGVELRVRIASLLGEPSPFASDDELARAKTRAKEVAEFAQRQRASGAPYLFSLCAVRLWALLEALIDELVVEALHRPSECDDQALLAKLKGPLVEFRSAPPDEQAEFLAETLKQAVDAPLKLGVGRFEALLEPIGLGGAVADSVRKTLFELSQVRNVIVHKSGRADRRFTEACPWLSTIRGSAVHVAAPMFRRYLTAAYWYVVELRGRVDVRGGKERTAEVERVLTELGRLLDPTPSSER